MRVEVMLPERAWEGVADNAQALLDAWLAAPGARVEAGQPLVRAVLVKSSLEVEAPVSGQLVDVRVPAGASFGRGQPLAAIETD